MTPHAPPESTHGVHDTTLEAAAVQQAAWRSMSGSERLSIALDLSTATHELALAGLRARYPNDAPEALVRRLHARR